MPHGHPRPWYRDSLFGDGPRCPLDRNQRARFKFLLDAHVRARRLPAKQERVGRALVKRLGADGRCDPTHATLAAHAGCSERTARRACETLRRLGLLRWQHRLVRAGWRSEQTSNAYVLMVTAANPAPLSSGGQKGRETKLIDKSMSSSSLPLFSYDERVAGQAALAEVLRRRQGVVNAMLANKGLA
jgi:hypothetical protein